LNKLFDIIIKNIDRIKSKINDIELEKQELSGNIIENKNKRLNLSETFDISRIRYDYGIKLKNDNLVRMNSKLLEIDTDGNLYFLNVNNPKEKEIIGKVENCLYEFDIFNEEWKKADIVRILSSTNFAIKGSKLKELSKAILENKGLELYSNINKNRKLGGLNLYEWWINNWKYKKEVEGRDIIDVKLKDMVELLNKYREDLNNPYLSDEKTLEECNSVVFNPLMEEYMGYRKAFIQKAISKEEFENLVETFVKQDKFYNLYEKAVAVSKSETESEEIVQWV